MVRRKRMDETDEEYWREQDRIVRWLISHAWLIPVFAAIALVGYVAWVLMVIYG